MKMGLATIVASLFSLKDMPSYAYANVFLPKIIPASSSQISSYIKKGLYSKNTSLSPHPKNIFPKNYTASIIKKGLRPATQSPPAIPKIFPPRHYTPPNIKKGLRPKMQAFFLFISLSKS